MTRTRWFSYLRVTLPSVLSWMFSRRRRTERLIRRTQRRLHRLNQERRKQRKILLELEQRLHPMLAAPAILLPTEPVPEELLTQLQHSPLVMAAPQPVTVEMPEPTEVDLFLGLRPQPSSSPSSES